MSRIGKNPVQLPAGVKAEVKEQSISVSGPKGQLSWRFSPAVQVDVRDNVVSVRRSAEDKRCRQLHGTTRAVIANMVRGVNEGYSKRLLIFGTGYSCNVQGRTLLLNLGYMGRSVNKGPQFSIPIPEGVEVTIETAAARGESDPAKLLVTGMDRQKVGQFAAEIRSLRKPEPYKGKGVRYEDEHVRRKQGKALASGG